MKWRCRLSPSLQDRTSRAPLPENRPNLHKFSARRRHFSTAPELIAFQPPESSLDIPDLGKCVYCCSTFGGSTSIQLSSRPLRYIFVGLTALAATSVAIAPERAVAAGFTLKEQSSTAQSTAFAGAAAGGKDISYMFFNPAAMALHPGTNFHASVSYIIPTSETKNAAGATAAGAPITGSSRSGDIGVDVLLPAVYSSYQVTDEIFLGLAVNSPFGLATENQDDWVGRYHGTDSELMTIDFNPAAAYKPFDWLNLGAGLQVVYASATLENAVDTSTIAGAPYSAANDSQSKVEGDDWGYGFTVGAIVEPMPGTRIGVAYRSEVDVTLDGDAKFKRSPLGDVVNAGTMTPGGAGLLGNSDVTVDLTMPDSINFGIHHDINEQWSVMADGSWTGWSDFKNLTIKFQNPDQPANTTVQDWNDTWFVALGTRFRPSKEWLLSLGVAYDESPVPTSTRTPRIPDADRYWISAGAGWKPIDWLAVNLSYTHIFMPDSKVRLTVADPNNLARGNLSANYESHIDILSFSTTISF